MRPPRENLRLELLRLRGRVERAQAAAALAELRTGTQRLQRLGGLAGSIAGALTGSSGGWLGAIASAIGHRPWLVSIAGGALRTLRRHPWATLAAVGALWLLRRKVGRGQDRGAGERSAAEQATQAAPPPPRVEGRD